MEITRPSGILTWSGETVLFDNSDVTVELNDPGMLVGAGSIVLKNCHIVESDLGVYDAPHSWYSQWQAIYSGNIIPTTGYNNTVTYSAEDASFLTIKRGTENTAAPIKNDTATPTPAPKPTATPTPKPTATPTPTAVPKPSEQHFTESNLGGKTDASSGQNTRIPQVSYRTHAQTYGWLGWAKNGQMAGTSGLAKRLEGINIKLVPKGGPAPGSTAKPNVVGGGGKLPDNPYKE